MQKGVLFKPDIHKGGLQVVFEILDAPLENAPDKTFLLRMLHHEFLEAAVLDNRHARFQSFDVYNDFTLHFRAFQPAKQIHANSSLLCNDML